MNSGCGGAPSVTQADSNMPHVNGMFETNVQWQSIKPRYRVALFVVQLPLHVFTEAGKEKTAAVYNTNLLKLTNLRTRYLVVSELRHCFCTLSYLDTPVPEVFFCLEERERRREKNPSSFPGPFPYPALRGREKALGTRMRKTLVAGDANLTIMLR